MSEFTRNFTHIDAQGNASMVDVSDKPVSHREAIASGFISMAPETVTAIEQQSLKKGDVLAVARIAGIQGAKRCADLIPLCHPLALSKVDIQFSLETNGISVSCLCKLSGQTGVEMEALTGVNVALLTLYDMCKAIDKEMVIEKVTLVKKRGGKSDYDRQ